MKNKKILIFVGLLLAAVAVFLFKDKLFKKAIASPNNSGGSGGGANPSNQYLIKQGSKGEKVRFLQAYMNDQHNKEKLMVDGIWGAKTQQAFERLVKLVASFGSSDGLTADEYKFIAPHEPWLRKTYFNKK